jgi:hypothetical protein
MSTENLLKDHKEEVIINGRASNLGELSGGVLGIHPSFF